MRLHDLLEAVSMTIDWVPPRQARAAMASGSEIVVWVDVAKIEAGWRKDRDMYIGPGGTGNVIGQRYPRFDMWMADRLPVEMSEISLGHNNIPAFTNGRHRWAWMRDHGAVAMPVVSDAAQAAEFLKLYGTDQRQTTISR